MARSSATSGRTARASRRRSASCSGSSVRQPGARRSSDATSQPTASARGAASATCPATSGSPTVSPAASSSTRSRAFAEVSTTALRDELCERLDVDLDRPIRQLSKGNRQKIGIVQAFMHRPDLVVLDEPTAGLDPLLQAEVQSAPARDRGRRSQRSSSRRTRSTRCSTSQIASGSSAPGDSSTSTRSRASASARSGT